MVTYPETGQEVMNPKLKTPAAVAITIRNEFLSYPVKEMVNLDCFIPIGNV